MTTGFCLADKGRNSGKTVKNENVCVSVLDSGEELSKPTELLANQE